MQKRKLGAVVVAVSLVSLVITTWALIASIQIRNTGHIGLLKAYADMECTIPVTTFEWGTLSPGMIYNKAVWIKNTGGEMLTLSLTLENIIPINLLDYMQVSWNRESAILGPESVLEATFTISVYVNATQMTEGAFSFDDIIAGTGA